MHTALEMKGISTKTICTACYHLTIVVFCTIKEPVGGIKKTPEN